MLGICTNGLMKNSSANDAAGGLRLCASNYLGPIWRSKAAEAVTSVATKIVIVIVIVIVIGIVIGIGIVKWGT